MIDYRLETFLTLCREHNYSRAAEKLCITQPAVTQHIQYLERYYNTKLFEYKNKQLYLTEEGKILERMAISLYSNNKRIQHLIANSKRKTTPIYFGASHSICETYIPNTMTKMYSAYSDLKINISADCKTALLKGLKEATYNAILIEGEFDKENYDHHLLTTDEHIVVSSKPIEFTCIEDLFQYTIVTNEKGFSLRTTLENQFQNLGISLHDFSNIIETNNLSLMKALIKNGIGIGFLNQSYVQQELKEGSLHKLAIGHAYPTEVNFVFLKDSLLREQYLDFYLFISKTL